MGILDNYFNMGLGTSRLPIKDINDKSGIEKSAQLILKALDNGVRYIDTSYPYSAGGAHAALKLAFEQTQNPYAVTVKINYQHDETADEARRRVENQLKTLGIEKAAFCICWCIPSYECFLKITRKNGIYDGALKLKTEGLIGHICCSLHASPEDSIKIIESGAFEAATISFNLANSLQTIPVLDAALKYNVDVSVMNPLGGGGIPQNPAFFSFAQAAEENTVTAALRFAGSHPAVKIVLCGLNNERELTENLKAFTEKSPEPASERIIRVTGRVKDIDGYCVNCHYCDGCPAGIPVSKLMNKRNRLLFPNIIAQNYKRTDPELLENINFFSGQSNTENSDEWFPISYENPCIKCGNCEKVCTQKLQVIKNLSDTYERAKKCGYSLEYREERLRGLLVGKGYKRVGLYPKDRFADLVIKLYSRFFGEPDFEWVVFNSDANMWGRVVDGLTIHAPNDILEIKPDIIIVCNYTYQEEIYKDLKQYETDGIRITKLHRDTDMPWVF
jgi:hypothetical protein